MKMLLTLIVSKKITQKIDTKQVIEAFDSFQMRIFQELELADETISKLKT